MWTTNETHGISFGHETSSDMINWNWEGIALNATGTGSWDDDNVWAPDIEYVNGTYYMFYTGVNRVDEDGLANHRERNGLATSTDLYNWTRYPVNNCFNTTGDGCLYDCDLDWNGWGTRSNAWAHQCRDPEIYYDDATGNWYMFLTTSIFVNDTLRSVLDLSKSNDLINWVDVGPLNFTLGPKVESPVIWKEGEYYYLFVTTHDSGRLHYSYTKSIEGNWSTPKVLPESCVSSIGGDCDGDRYMIANEFIVTPEYQLFAYVAGNTRNINFEEFEIVQEDNLHDVMFKPSTSLGSCTNYFDPASVNPGVQEVCEDGIDNNCDGFDSLCDALYCDSDLDCIDRWGDGIYQTNGICNLVTNQCEYTEYTCTDLDDDGYYVQSSNCDGLPGFLGYNDCDDSDNEIFYLQDFYLNEDHDSYGTGEIISTQCWGIGGNWQYPLDERSFNNLDCDDLDPLVWRWVTLYSDSDGDGYGWVNDTDGLDFCLGDNLLEGGSVVNNDCKDREEDCADVFGSAYLYCIFNLNLINPGTTEICGNDIDDDCDGLIDAADLGPVCYPTCSEGDMNLANYPCKCETGGVVRTFFSPPGSTCDYCCGGLCWDVSCDTYPQT